ncbi:hypothetical protein RCL1_007555 [Eukaryota sp. TZLM3-RCL]
MEYLCSAKTAFNLLHEDYPLMTEYTSLNSSIVHFPSFESAVVKILEGNEDTRSVHQRSAVAMILKTHEELLQPDFPTSLSLQNLLKSRLPQHSIFPVILILLLFLRLPTKLNVSLVEQSLQSAA